MKIKSRSNDICQLNMYTLQSFHTPNINELLSIVLKNRPNHKNLTLPKKHENEVKVRWHLSVGYEHLTIIPYTKYSRPFA